MVMNRHKKDACYNGIGRCAQKYKHHVRFNSKHQLRKVSVIVPLDTQFLAVSTPIPKLDL